MSTPVALAPVVLAQLSVVESGSEIVKLTAPLGATAPVVPVTVALKISTPPRVGVDAVLIATAGVTAATVLVGDEAAMVL